MEKDSRIYVASRDKLVGTALIRQLRRQGYHNFVRDEDELDLTNCDGVDRLFASQRPEYVFLTGGKSGGIKANQKRSAELMLDNLLVESHVIQSAYVHRIHKLMYLASSCIYPKLCPQPMRIESLLTGPLEPTNEAYAVAKIAGLKLCQAYRQQYQANFIGAISANPFGIGDDFTLEDSHVIAALLRRMHEAKVNKMETVSIWGSGKAEREFIFADDLADACIFLLEKYEGSVPVNIGSGFAVSIRQLADLIKDVVGYSGRLQFDSRKPEGMPVKILDSSRLFEMGWRPKVSFPDALQATYDWFLSTAQEA